ncbi:MAG TPA: condensation domain-containing protein, partial [Actinophytocola sp.]|nr:condensation domain-containing protein [Actinophytocola sp.]
MTVRERTLASFGQARLWFLDQLRPGSPDYLLPMALRIRGRLDVPALAGAVAAIVERHPVLRSRYSVVAGELMQCPADAAEIFRTRDLTDVSEDDFIAAELRSPMDLATQPPLRVVLGRVTEHHHLLLVVAHHIAFDGLSWAIFGAELSALYRGDELPPLAAGYADFAQWQRERLDGPRTAASLEHWRASLRDLTPLRLPTDRPRPPVWDGAGDVVRFEVPADLLAGVDAVAKSRRATRYMVLLAAFQTLLARYTGQTDIAVGAPVAGRGRPTDAALIGLFVNSVVLRTDVSGRPSFDALVDRVRA